MKASPKPTAKQSGGRGPKKYVRTITYDLECEQLVRFYVPSGKEVGRFLARCVYEFHARKLFEAELLTRMARERGPDAALAAEVPGGKDSQN